MMIEPSISDLMNKFDSRYSLVIAVAKRAREISASDGQLARPVTQAVNEVAKGNIKVIKPVEEQIETENINYVDYVEPSEGDNQE